MLDAVTGWTIATLDCTTSPGALAFVSNDELIVGMWDGRTQLWNLLNRQVVGSAIAHKNVVAAAAFSPDTPVLREATRDRGLRSCSPEWDDHQRQNDSELPEHGGLLRDWFGHWLGSERAEPVRWITDRRCCTAGVARRAS